MLRVQLEAGFTPSQALERLAGPGRVGRWARAMAASIERGAPLHEAAALAPGLFSPADRALLRMGEETGSLPAVLASIEHSALWLGRLRERSLGALFYPVFLLNLACLCLSVGDLVQGRLLAFLGGWLGLNLVLAGVATSFALAWRHPRGRALLDGAALAVPGPGLLLRRPILCFHRSLFFGVLGRCLEVGLGPREALALALDVLPNARVREELGRAEEGLGRGLGLGESLSGCELLSASQRSVLTVMEQTGKLPEALTRGSRLEAERLDEWLTQYTRLLPVALLVLTVLYLASRVL
jgi:general secretion pathway protein F